jgi:hypothetical protein
VRFFTGLPYRDTQSGLKAVKKDRLEKVFSSMMIKRFAFDVELLVLSNLYNLHIAEVPIQLELSNKLFNFKEIFRMFIDVLAITYRVRIKKQYKKNENSLV